MVMCQKTGKVDQMFNPLLDYLEDFGIAQYEQRTFMSVFVHYVNIREEWEYTHSDTLAMLLDKVGCLSSHMRDALHDVYRLIEDQPELYW